MTRETVVYFAHPYNTVGSDGEREIIEELKSRQVSIFNPFKEEGDVLEKYGKEEYYKGPTYWQLARDIWTKDLGAVKKCDILLAWLPNKEGIGTSAEIATAYEYKKFIQIISPYRHPSFSVYADQYFLSIRKWKRRILYKWEEYNVDKKM